MIEDGKVDFYSTTVASDLFLAFCSLNAYDDSISRLQEYFPLGSSWQYSQLLQDTLMGTTAIVLISKDKTGAILAFRGTLIEFLPPDKSDLTTDLQAMFGPPMQHPTPNTGNVITSLYLAWANPPLSNKSIMKQFNDWLTTNLNPSASNPITVTITGHSLGASLAFVAAADIGYLSNVTTKVVGFGGFPIGDTTFVNNLLSIPNSQYRCYVDVNDMVINSATWWLTIGAKPYGFVYAPLPNVQTQTSGTGHSMASYLASQYSPVTLSIPPAQYYSFIKQLTISLYTSLSTVPTADISKITGSIHFVGDLASSSYSVRKILDLIPSKLTPNPNPQITSTFQQGQTDTYNVNNPLITIADLANGFNLEVDTPLNPSTTLPESITIDSVEILADGYPLFWAGPGFGEFNNYSTVQSADAQLTTSIAIATNCVWTSAYCNNTEGTWLQKFMVPRCISGMTVYWQNDRFGVIDVALNYRQCSTNLNSPRSTNNNDGSPYSFTNNGQLVTGVAVKDRGGSGVVDICLFFSDNSNIWVVNSQQTGTIHPNLVPSGCAVCGIYVSEQDGYGIVDVQIGYISLSS